MHQLHKRLTGAANSSIEIIIAWSELLQMRKRLFVRNWIRRLLRYLCIPVGFFLVVVPLYSLMIRQTIQAQSSSTMEMLAIGTTQLERCLSNIRSTTNKLFSETEYTLLASSYDNSILGDYQTLTRASKSLQDKQPIMACGHGAGNRGCNSLGTRLQNSQNSAAARCGKIQRGI